MRGVVNPSATEAYKASTQKQLYLNHSSRRCPGCTRRRSFGQFKTADAEYCLTCTRRGINTPKSTVRKPAGEASK